MAAKRSNAQTDAHPLTAVEPATEVEALAAVRTLLRFIGEDPNREGLIETPDRVVRAFDEMFSGYSQDITEILGTVFDAEGYNEMVILRNIEFNSTCEHHMLPFAGIAHVGYIPGDRIVGLSKLARVVDAFARRLQVQERLTNQIAVAINEALMPRGVGVIVEAKHHCMLCRGVMKRESSMITSKLMGAMFTAAARAEFLALASNPARP